MIDITNPSFDPQHCLEEYLESLCEHNQICYVRIIKGKFHDINKKVLISTPLNINQLQNWIAGRHWIILWHSREIEECTKELIYIWQQSGWVMQNKIYEHKTIYGWEYNFTNEGMKIIQKILDKINQALQDVPNKDQPHP